jgi:hypothetical protein
LCDISLDLDKTPTMNSINLENMLDIAKEFKDNTERTDEILDSIFEIIDLL